MFAHRICVIPFTKITMFPYSEQVEELCKYIGDNLKLKWTNSNLSNVFLWSFGFEHYAASFGDDFDAKMN